MKVEDCKRSRLLGIQPSNEGLIQCRTWNVVVEVVEGCAVSALVQYFPFSYDPGRGGSPTLVTAYILHNTFMSLYYINYIRNFDVVVSRPFVGR